LRLIGRGFSPPKDTEPQIEEAMGSLTTAVKLVSPIVVGVAISVCATDYGSQLAEPNYGRHGKHYTEGNMDPTMLMNGIYASKQLNGPSMPLAAFCLTDYRCSLQSQLSSSGWAP